MQSTNQHNKGIYWCAVVLASAFLSAGCTDESNEQPKGDRAAEELAAEEQTAEKLGTEEPAPPFREDEVTPEIEASLESALRALDRDDIVITYDEGTSTMEAHVDLEQFEELAQGSTIEMSVDVKSPDGTAAHHELAWTSGEDLKIPQIAMQAASMGRYEVKVTGLAIDGQPVLDGPTLLQTLELMDEVSPAAQDLQVRAPNDSADSWRSWLCRHTRTIHGSPGSDTLYGGKRHRDTIYGYGGDDVLISGKCGDNLWGGEGNDVLRAETGVDTCFGGPGVDQFYSCEYIVDNEVDYALAKDSLDELTGSMQASEAVRESYGIVTYEKSTDRNGVTSVLGLDGQERVVLEVRYGDGGLSWRGFAVEPFTVDESLTVDPEGHLVEPPVVNEAMPAKMEEVLNDLTSELNWPLGNCWTLGGQCAVQALAAGLCVPVCSSGNVAACVGCVVQTAPDLYTACEEYVAQCL